MNDSESLRKWAKAHQDELEIVKRAGRTDTVRKQARVILEVAGLSEDKDSE